jgi:hypothetical protein
MRNRFIGLTAVLLFIGLVSVLTADIPDNQEVTTVIVIRHAERDPGKDPPLNKRGEIRSWELLRTLEKSGLTAIYCTNFVRNVQTVKPLAEKLNLDVQLIPDSLLSDTRALARYFTSRVWSLHKGGVILYVGNQKSSVKGQMGNMQEVYRTLGGDGTPLSRYPDMYIFTFIGEEPVRIIKATYGGPGE